MPRYSLERLGRDIFRDYRTHESANSVKHDVRLDLRPLPSVAVLQRHPVMLLLYVPFSGMDGSAEPSVCFQIIFIEEAFPVGLDFWLFNIIGRPIWI